MNQRGSVSDGLSGLHDAGSRGVEGGSEFGVGGSGGSLPERVFDGLGIGKDESSRLSFSELFLGELGDRDDIDSFARDAMVSAHLVVHLVDGAVDGGVAVLLEDVVDSDGRTVFQENSEVLRGGSSAFEDLLNTEKLSFGLAKTELGQVEFPELGSGQDGVRCVDPSAHDLRSRALLSGESAPVDQEASSAIARGFVKLALCHGFIT